MARGVDDWVDLGLVIDVAQRAGWASDEARTSLAIGLVSIVIVEGLMVAGVVREDSFRPWSESHGDAVVRIVREWRKAGTRLLLPGEIAWLCNTAAGDALGHAILDGEQR